MPDATDPDVTWFEDEPGARLLVGVETEQVKLAVVLPEDVPRSKVRRTVRECSRELEHYVQFETADAGRQSDRVGD